MLCQEAKRLGEQVRPRREGMDVWWEEGAAKGKGTELGVEGVPETAGAGAKGVKGSTPLEGWNHV